MLGGKHLARDILQLLCCDVVNTLHELIEIAFLTIMQKMLGHVKGILFPIVAGNGYLTL